MLKTRALLLVPILFAAGCGSRTDAGLIEKFEQNRGRLDELVSMFNEDVGLTRVTMDATTPEDPADADVSPERIAQYRAICEQLEAEGCIEGVEPEEAPAPAEDTAEGAAEGSAEEEEEEEFSTDKTVIWVHMEERADDASGKRRGYLYSHQPPFQVVKDVDEVRMTASSTWLQQIDGPWYLYLDYRD